MVIPYATRVHNMPNGFLIEEFDALKDPQLCETLNAQVVADLLQLHFINTRRKTLSYVEN